MLRLQPHAHTLLTHPHAHTHMHMYVTFCSDLYLLTVSCNCMAKTHECNAKCMQNHSHLHWAALTQTYKGCAHTALMSAHAHTTRTHTHHTLNQLILLTSFSSSFFSSSVVHTLFLTQEHHTHPKTHTHNQWERRP